MASGTSARRSVTNERGRTEPGQSSNVTGAEPVPLVRDQTFGAADRPPRPLQFDVKDILGLVQRLHSSEEHMQTRWLNALVGRIFLAVHRTRDVETFITDKLGIAPATTTRHMRILADAGLVRATLEARDRRRPFWPRHIELQAHTATPPGAYR